ncbi:hypothetical protein PENTCL1PPCAC_5906, partial [Pristionchus entomophagus]
QIINLTHWLSIVLFVLAVVLNLVLIYAITRHSSIHAGGYYKHTQRALAYTNIIVAGIIMVCRPAIHLHGGVFFMGGHLRFLPFSFTLGVILIYSYIAIYVQKTIAQGTIMMFRVWSMSRRLSSFPEYYLLLIPIIAFSIALPPTIYHMIEVFPSEETQDICLVKDYRGICTETIGHAVRRHLAPDSGFLVSPLQLNDWHNYALTVSLILMLLLMVASGVVVLVGSVWIMKQAGESHDIKLHRQLARALLLQSFILQLSLSCKLTLFFQIAVPAVLMQLPMMVGLIGSLLKGKMDLLLMSIPILNSLYTCIDPLVIIISVKSYRRGLAGVLHIPLSQGSSAVAPLTHEQKTGRPEESQRRLSAEPHEH